MSTSEAPAAPDVSPKRAQNLARKILAGGDLSRRNIEEVTKVLKNKNEKDSQAFLTIMREKSGKSEDELLVEMEALLREKGSHGTREQLDRRSLEKVHIAWRLQQRGLTWDQIAETMGCSYQAVGQYLKKAKDLLRIEPTTISLPDKVGETLAFYEDVRQMALAIASGGSKATNPQKLDAMRVAAVIERDKNEFLTRVGVYSPAVIETFRALVLQQVTVLHGGGAGDKKENPVDLFFHGLAKDLMEQTYLRNKGGQALIEGEAIEIVERPVEE